MYDSVEEMKLNAGDWWFCGDSIIHEIEIEE